MAILQPGEYRARAVKGALGVSQNGNEQVGVEFELIEVPGQHITWYGTFTDAAFDIAMRGLRSAGMTGDDLSDFSWVEKAPEVMLVVDHETYQGKTKVKVKFINSLGGLAMKKPLEGVEARSFAERMRAKVLLFNQGQPPPKREEHGGGPNGEPSPFNEDIPF